MSDQSDEILLATCCKYDLSLALWKYFLVSSYNIFLDDARDEKMAWLIIILYSTHACKFSTVYY